jgi:transposase-like protein
MGECRIKGLLSGSLQVDPEVYRGVLIFKRGGKVYTDWVTRSTIASIIVIMSSQGAASHINGIEFFWLFAKRRLMKFHGIAESTFYLHLKECEFRLNYRDETIYIL